MISSVRGPVLHVGPDAVEVLVGGIGFTVLTTPDVVRSARAGDPLELHTSLIVREDSLTLYGFGDRAQTALFGVLLGVTGVGPRSALGVLAALSVDQIAEAVASDDDAPFRRVSGIGPKTAKLIVVQLAGKLAPPPARAAAPGSATTDVAGQVARALVGLGWSERTASEAVAQAVDGATEAERAAVPALLRRTLAELGPARREPSGG